MTTRKTLLLTAIAVASLMLITLRLSADFSGTDLVLPAAGRVLGAGGTEFVTTGFVTNLTDHAVDVQYQFLQDGQANLTPLTVNDTLAPGEGKTYEDMTTSLFHRVGIRVRTRQTSDPSAADVTQLSFNASFQYTPN